MLNSIYNLLFENNNKSTNTTKLYFDKSECSLEEFNNINFIHSNNNDHIVIPKDCIVVRLAGCDFMTFTRGLCPHDRIIQNCFVEVTEDLIEQFNARAGYTIGDNILLFFHKNNASIIQETSTQLSKISSYCTLKFDKYLNKHIDLINTHYNARVAQHLLDYDFIFRGMALNLSEEEVYQYINYIYYKSTDHLEENIDNYGILVKTMFTNKDTFVPVYKEITNEEYDETLGDLTFILKMFIYECEEQLEYEGYDECHDHDDDDANESSESEIIIKN